jgi:hypothetical protein
MTKDVITHFLTCASRSKSVKIAFHNHKNSRENTIRVKLSIGADIASDLQWKDGIYLQIEGDRNILYLSKSIQSDDKEYKTFKGHKFKKIKGSYSYSVTFTSFFIPEIKSIRPVPFEIVDAFDEPSKDKCLKIFLEMIK